MDSTALLHDYYTIGADSAMSGLVVLLAAAQSLIAVKEEIRNLTNSIVFTVFNSESYDLVGSRKFLEDIDNFKCTQKMTDEKDGPYYSNGCWKPYSTSLD